MLGPFDTTMQAAWTETNLVMGQTRIVAAFWLGSRAAAVVGLELVAALIDPDAVLADRAGMAYRPRCLAAVWAGCTPVLVAASAASLARVLAQDLGWCVEGPAPLILMWNNAKAPVCHDFIINTI